jgi:transcriptional regulator with XRE-family HTH domain
MAEMPVGAFTKFVAGRIQATRKHRKMTEAELASKTNIPKAVIISIEKGEAHITLEQLARFTKVFTAMSALLGLPNMTELEMKDYLDSKINAMTEEQLRAWQAKPPSEPDNRNLYILEIHEEDE